MRYNVAVQSQLGGGVPYCAVGVGLLWSREYDGLFDGWGYCLGRAVGS